MGEGIVGMGKGIVGMGEGRWAMRGDSPRWKR